MTASPRTVPSAIPIELYRSIFKWVAETNDLCSLARSSIILQLEAERFLYERIEISDVIRFIKMAKSIISCPRRQLLVRVLIHHRSFQDGRSCFDRSSILRLLANLLRVTTQLTILTLHASPGWVLDRANHPGMKCLSLHMSKLHFKESAQYNGYLNAIRYMERHPTVTTLTFTSHQMLNPSEFKNHPPAPCSLPLLHSLHTFAPYLLFVTQNRQLTRFCLRPCSHSQTIQAISHLLNMGSSLVVLDLSDIYMRWNNVLAVPEVERITRSLPNLQYFGLPIPMNHREEDWERGLACAIQCHLPKLVVLKLSNCIEAELVLPRVQHLLVDTEALTWIVTIQKYSSITVAYSYSPLKKLRQQQISEAVDLHYALWDTGVRMGPFGSISWCDDI